jgi:putative cardiolipin synthase
VGNEYFTASSDVDFSDLDALAAGPVVPDVSAEFDTYWNSTVVWPITAVAKEVPTAAEIQAHYDALDRDMTAEKESDYAQALPNLALIQAIRDGRWQAYHGTCRVISDPPTKITQPIDESAHAIVELRKEMESAKTDILLVSPYFVPGPDGTKWLSDVAARGIRVRILTNSFLANDVGAVHAGYAPYRKKLLQAGVEIYELKASAYKELPKSPEYGTAGGSQASLHAKTYLVDQNKVFIGSLNLDPRSAVLNTEMGLVIDSPKMAGRFIERFDKGIINFAYQVRLLPDGGMTWTTREAGQEVVLHREPGIGPVKRIWHFVLRVLPVEEQL